MFEKQGLKVMVKAMRQGRKHKVAFLNILKYFMTEKRGILILGL